ncbi:MAG: hypothetical protein WAK95_07990 [Desulfobacterales bacterium]
MPKTDARSTGEKSAPPRDTIDRLENDIDDIREEASETIDEIKAKAKMTGEKVKERARETASRAGEKIKSAADAAADYPAHADSVTRTGMYVGVGLVAAGLVIGVAALLYGKSEKRGPTRPDRTPDELTGTLSRARAEAMEKKRSCVIVTPQETERQR